MRFAARPAWSRLTTLFVALALSVVVVGCGGSSGSSGDTSGAITIGVVAPFSGSLGQLGPIYMDGCYAAIQQINSGGGVLGKQVTCRPVDSTGDPADAVPSVTRALSTSHLTVVSGVDTTTGATVAPLINHARIPFFTASGLAEFDQSQYPYLWRNAPSDPQNGASFAIWAERAGYRRVALVFQSGVANQGLVPGVTKGLAHFGVTVAANLTVPPAATSYASVVERVIASKPDAIIAEGDPQTLTTFLSQYKQLHNGSIPPLITGTDLQVPSFFTGIAKALGAQYVSHDIAMVGYVAQAGSPAFKAYTTGLYSSRAKKDASSVSGNGVLAATYDGMVILALAIDAAKSTTGPVVNQAIPTVTTASPGVVVVHTYAAGVAALKAGKHIDFAGTGGQITFDKYHNSPGNFSASGFTKDGGARSLGFFPGTQVLSALA